MKTYLLSLICLLFILHAFGQDEKAISGFIEFPNSVNTQEIDFKTISIQLFDENNSLVDQANCADNGFYLLTIYNLKNYYIKVDSKESLSFEPSKYELNFENKQNDELEELLNQQYNFKFSGFSISGQVFSEYSTDKLGPKGIALSLFQNNEKISETLTKEKGYFSFEKVSNGNYIIKPSTVKQLYTIAENQEIACKVNLKQQYSCTGAIYVNGYSIKGKLLNNKIPLKNFYGFLYFENQDQSIKYTSKQKVINDHPLKKSQDYVDYAVIKTNGMIEFNAIPHGTYKILIQPINEQIQLNHQPSAHINIVHNNLQFEQEINIESVNIFGKIQAIDKKIIDQTMIYVNNQEYTTVDQEGKYTLNNLQLGAYNITAKNTHYLFKTLVNQIINVNFEELPKLLVNQYHLCGQINLLDEQNLLEKSTIEISVIINTKENKEQVKVSTAGDYCHWVEPGTYSLTTKVHQKSKETKHFLSLTPQIQTVEITNQPKLEVNFNKQIFHIEGIVKFQSSIDPKLQQNIEIQLLQNNNVISKLPLPSSLSFTFQNLNFGEYEVQIVNDYIAFDETIKSVSLHQNERLTQMVFKQTGFYVNYETPISIKGKLFKAEKMIKDITLRQGKNKLEFEEDGQYEIKPDSCYKFKEESFKFDLDFVLEKNIILLTPLQLQLKGKVVVHLNTKVSKDKETIQNFIQQFYKISIQSYNSKNKKQLVDANVLQLNYIKEENNKLIYIFDNFQKLNTINTVTLLSENIEIPENISKNKVLNYYLKSLIINQEAQQISIINACQDLSKSFEILSGKIFFGEISPTNLTQVTINVHSLINRKKGKLVQSIINNSSKFEIRNLEPNVEYELVIKKKSYEFSVKPNKIDDNIVAYEVFGKKLSSIVVKVQDENNIAVPNVSIFLQLMSKKSQLKITNQTDKDGIYENNELTSGNFLIKPAMKEFQFTPSQQTIKLNVGDDQEIIFVGKQVAFSVYGKVTNINQQGIENINIVAYPHNENTIPKINNETAITDAKGNFRIRGLFPQAVYDIIIQEAYNIQYFIPKQQNIVMSKADLNDIDFTLFVTEENQYSLSGSIDIDKILTKEQQEEIQNSLEVELYLEATNKFINTTFTQIVFNKYFEFEKLQKDKYYVIIKYKLNGMVNQQSIYYNLQTLEEKDINLEKVITISLQNKEKENEFSNFNFILPFFLLTAIYALINMEKSKSLIISIIKSLKSLKKEEQKLKKESKLSSYKQKNK